MKYYLAGPMSGIPQFNFPTFFAAAENLRASGFDIVSPAEIDNEEDAGAALASPDGDLTNHKHVSGKTWGDFLARDVKLVADDVQGIVLLPGWEESRGARLEAFLALTCGHKILYYMDDDHYGSYAVEANPEDVLTDIYWKLYEAITDRKNEAA